MGYYINIVESDIFIDSQDKEDAYKALCELNNHNEFKTGGSWPRVESDVPNSSVWFAWMPWNYPETCETLEEILRELGFDVIADEDGNIVELYYNDKSGNQDHFLKALAPYVRNNSYIIWQGEDHSVWRMVFENGTMTEKSGRVVFD